MIIKAEVINVIAWGTVPVQVITTSICRMTSLSLTTRKPSMLCGNTNRIFYCEQLETNNQIHCSVCNTANLMHKPGTEESTFNDGAVLTGNGLVTHHACRAQMGSISVMHTMAPRALRAVQQPFPTYRPQERTVDININLQ